MAIFVFVLFWPPATVEFMMLDDWQYVVDNPFVRVPSWQGVAQVFAEMSQPSTVDGYYQPLAMVSLMLDGVLSGVDVPSPFVFRLTNVFFHALASIAVMLIVREAVGGIWIPMLIAALFAAHPVQVESVAWISQRKTVLSGWLALSATWSYMRYRRTGRAGWMATATGMIALAVLAKPTAVLIPFTWPLLDFWPLRVKTKWPALAAPFVIVVIAGAIAWKSQAGSGAKLSAPAASRALDVSAVVLASIGQYLANLLAPMELSPYRAIGGLNGFRDPWVIVTGVVLLLWAAAAWHFRRRSPVVWVSGLCFFVLLGPAVGIFRFDETIVADRFLYLPLAFGLLAAAWLAREIERRHAQGLLVASSVLATMLIAGAALNRAQQGVWHTSIVLWTHIAEVYPGFPKAEYSLAAAQLEQGLAKEALPHAIAAAEAAPNKSQHIYIVGRALVHVGRPDEGLEHLRRALEMGLGPQTPWCHATMAHAYILRGDATAARAEIQSVRATGDVDAREYAQLADVAAGKSTTDFAELTVELYDLAIDRGGPEILWQWNRGAALARAGRWPEALATYDRVLSELDRAGMAAPAIFLKARSSLVEQMSARPATSSAADAADSP